MSGTMGGAFKAAVGASNSASVGKAVAAAAATASSVAVQNPTRCDRAVVNFGRRGVAPSEDDWQFVGDLREDELQEGMAVMRATMQGKSSFDLEVKTVPEDTQSVSSDDTESSDANRIIEQAEHEIVYGRPKDRMSDPTTNEWCMMEKIIYAAAKDPQVQRSIFESEHVQEAIKQLKSGPLTLKGEVPASLLPVAARISVLKTEEEESNLDKILNSLKGMMENVCNSLKSGFNMIKGFVANMVSPPEKDAPNKSSSSDHGIGRVIITGVVLVILVVVLRRAGVRVSSVRR